MAFSREKAFSDFLRFFDLVLEFTIQLLLKISQRLLDLFGINFLQENGSPSNLLNISTSYLAK